MARAGGGDGVDAKQVLDARAATREMAEAMATQERLTQGAEDRAARLRRSSRRRRRSVNAPNAPRLFASTPPRSRGNSTICSRDWRGSKTTPARAPKKHSPRPCGGGVGLDPRARHLRRSSRRDWRARGAGFATRVSELEDRVSELASAMVDSRPPPPTNPSSASHPRPDDEPVVRVPLDLDPRVPGSIPGRAVLVRGSGFTREGRAAGRGADVPGTLDRSRAVEATAAAALAQVNVLREEIAMRRGALRTAAGDEHSRRAPRTRRLVRATLTAVAASFSRRGRRAAAVEIASTTSPGPTRQALPSPPTEPRGAWRLTWRADWWTWRRASRNSRRRRPRRGALAAVPNSPPPSTENPSPADPSSPRNARGGRPRARSSHPRLCPRRKHASQPRVAEDARRAWRRSSAASRPSREATAASVDPGSVDPAHPSPGTSAYAASPGSAPC